MSQERELSREVQQNFTQLDEWSTQKFPWGSFNISEAALETYGVIPLTPLSDDSVLQAPLVVPRTLAIPGTHIWLLSPGEHAEVDVKLRGSSVAKHKIGYGNATLRTQEDGMLLLGVSSRISRHRKMLDGTNVQDVHRLMEENRQNQEYTADQLSILVSESIKLGFAQRDAQRKQQHRFGRILKHRAAGSVVVLDAVAYNANLDLGTPGRVLTYGLGAAAVAGATRYLAAARTERKFTKAIKRDIYEVFSPYAFDDSLRHAD